MPPQAAPRGTTPTNANRPLLGASKGLLPQ